MKEEIKINQAELSAAIATLSRLKAGTGFLGLGEPVFQSVGDVADRINEAFLQLSYAEAGVLAVLEKLEANLKQAGIQFMEMDEANATIYQQIVGIRKGSH